MSLRGKRHIFIKQKSQRKQRVTKHWDEISVRAQWEVLPSPGHPVPGQLLLPRAPVCLPVRPRVPTGGGSPAFGLAWERLIWKGSQMSIPAKQERAGLGVCRPMEISPADLWTPSHTLSRSATRSVTPSVMLLSCSLCNCPSKFRVAFC